MRSILHIKVTNAYRSVELVCFFNGIFDSQRRLNRTLSVLFRSARGARDDCNDCYGIVKDDNRNLEKKIFCLPIMVSELLALMHAVCVRRCCSIINCTVRGFVGLAAAAVAVVEKGFGGAKHESHGCASTNQTPHGSTLRPSH